jgi:hypothetical protein
VLLRAVGLLQIFRYGPQNHCGAAFAVTCGAERQAAAFGSIPYLFRLFNEQMLM